MENSLEDLIAAIDEEQVEYARDLLRPMLQSDPSAEVYYLASQVAISLQQEKTFLEKAVELDPFHVNARNKLKALNLENQQSMGNIEILKAAEIIPQIREDSSNGKPSMVQEFKEEKKITKSIRQMRGMFGFFGIVILFFAVLAFLDIFVVGDGFYLILTIILGMIGACFLMAFKELGKRTKNGLTFARISSILFLLAVPSIILPIFGIVYLLKLSKPDMKGALSN